MNYEKILAHTLYTILIGISGFGVHFLRELSNNVGDLNSKMAVMIEKTQASEARDLIQDQKIDYLLVLSQDQYR